MAISDDLDSRMYEQKNGKMFFIQDKKQITYRLFCSECGSWEEYTCTEEERPLFCCTCETELDYEEVQ